MEAHAISRSAREISRSTPASPTLHRWPTIMHQQPEQNILPEPAMTPGFHPALPSSHGILRVFVFSSDTIPGLGREMDRFSACWLPAPGVSSGRAYLEGWAGAGRGRADGLLIAGRIRRVQAARSPLP